MTKVKQSRNKFNAKKTIVDGIVFHSAAEANRYKILKLLNKSGHIVNLKLQEPFVFKLHGKKISRVISDKSTEKALADMEETLKGMVENE